MKPRQFGKGCATGGVALASAVLLVSRMAGAAAQTPPAPLNPLHGLRKEALTGFRERPLFAPSRAQPHPDAAEAAPLPSEPAPSQAQLPDMHLVGIVGGSNSVAIVRQGESGKTILLANGDKLGAWRVTVLDQALRLEADGRIVSLALFAPRTAPAALADSPPPDPVLPPTASGEAPPGAQP